MKLFIDTANVDEIRQASELGVICGVTTNPSLIAKEGRVFADVVREITRIVDGPISAEVVASEADGMVAEATELTRIHKNIVIKIPMTAEGLKAVRRLSAMGVHGAGAARRARRRDVRQPVRRSPQRYLVGRQHPRRGDRQDLFAARDKNGDHRRQHPRPGGRGGRRAGGRAYRHRAV